MKVVVVRQCGVVELPGKVAVVELVEVEQIRSVVEWLCLRL